MICFSRIWGFIRFIEDAHGERCANAQIANLDSRSFWKEKRRS
jgi:hypothetical protein